MKKKRLWILTMFPDFYRPLLDFGVVGSALRNERCEVGDFELNTVCIADFCKKSFKGVDDSPFGGGAGMIMRPDVLENAILKGVIEKGGYNLESIKTELQIVCPLPRGRVWNHKLAREFANDYLSFDSRKDIVFISGRYEGIDERFLEKYVDAYYSVGDYILSGGDLAVMLILDSALRFVPQVLGNKVSAEEESFSTGLLEYPLYTRPREFNGVMVPEPMLSGDHKKIEEFKTKMAREMTKKYRPDLLKD
jgi:tRNA (guanine37-N1)-methyltransferase